MCAKKASCLRREKIVTADEKKIQLFESILASSHMCCNNAWSAISFLKIFLVELDFNDLVDDSWLTNFFLLFALCFLHAKYSARAIKGLYFVFLLF